jgi:hypothetical protein
MKVLSETEIAAETWYPFSYLGRFRARPGRACSGNRWKSMALFHWKTPFNLLGPAICRESFSLVRLPVVPWITVGLFC